MSGSTAHIAGWKTSTLGEVTDTFDSQRVPVKKANRIPGPYPYYGASGVVDYVHDYIFDGEYLLIAEDGENVKSRKTPIVFLVNGKFWVNNHAHILTANASADNRFLYYYITNSDINAFVSGSTRPKLTKGSLNQIPVLLPPHAEQQVIAAVLSSLDDKIELLRRQNETLEKIAQAIFKEWFVEFNFPDKNGKPYKASGCKMVDSDLGPIPEGWRVKELSSLVDHMTNTLSPSTAATADFWHYSIPSYDTNKSPLKEKGKAILSNKFKVPANVVLVSKLNPTTPRIWLVFDPEANSICSTEFQVISPKQSTNLPFVYSLLRSELVMRDLAAKAQGTSSSHQRIRPEDILDTKLSVPESRILGIYDTAIRPLFRKIDRNQKQSWSLVALRDALLPKLMSGELRVGG